MSGFRNNTPQRGPGGPRGGANAGSGGQTQAPRSATGGQSNAGERGRLEGLLRAPPQAVRYFADNDSKAIKPELLSAEAEEVAKRLADVPTSQLRRFYAEVMALKRRAELTGISNAEIKARLTPLRAKAAYTWGRQQKYPFELVAFFNRHAHAVQSKHDFLSGFQPHFEAVMAFHRVFAKKQGAEE
jgi:CRISPR type III-A-associated protein Csm2